MSRVLVATACLCLVASTATAQPGDEPLANMIASLAKEGLITTDEGYQALRPEALPVLIGAMQHPDSEARVLATIGFAGAGATSRLQDALNDTDPGVRTAAAYGLKAVGPPAVGAAPSLVKALSDPDRGVRDAAAQALGALGPSATAPLRSVLRFPSGEARRLAIRSLSHLRCAGPALASVLLDPDPKVRQAATTALKRMGRPAASALGEQLSDPDEGLRRHAALGLSLLGADAAPACVALARALGDADAEVRALAQQSLRSIGKDAADAVPALAEQLLHGGPKARELAAATLVTVGDRAAPASLYLVWALADPQPAVRKHAAHALFRLGETSLPAALGREAIWDQVSTLHAGQKAQPGVGSISGILEDLRDERSETRLEAVSELGLIGRDAFDTLSEVALRHRDWRVREQAIRGLGRLGPLSIRPLALALQDPRRLVRLRAALVLDLLSERVRPVVPNLIDALIDEDPLVRAQVAGTLVAQGEDVAPFVPRLVEMMRDARHAERETSLRVLRSTGLQLKGRGRLYWWVVPQVYRSELFLLGLLLVGWFGVAACVAPVSRPGRRARLATAVVAIVPIALGGGALAHAVTRPWAAGFLPDGAVPFWVSLLLSYAFVCSLGAVWARSRRATTRPYEPGLRAALRRLFFHEPHVAKAFVPSRTRSTLLWARERRARMARSRSS